MIADLQFIIQMFGGNYQYQSKTQSYVKGELTESLADAVDIFCAVLPMDGQTLRNTPEGEYTTDDKIILTKSDTTLQNGDIIIADQSYEIRTQTDLANIVGIKKYIAKKVNQ